MKSSKWDAINTCYRKKIITEEQLLTEKQWYTLKYVPKDEESGQNLKTGRKSVKYYFPDEVRKMTEEELQNKKQQDKLVRERRINRLKELRQTELDKLDELELKCMTLKNNCMYLINRLVEEKTEYKTDSIKENMEVVIDVETTGLDETDELLQISIIDISGKILFNSYIKPVYHESWPQAEAVNQIGWETVKDSPELWEVSDEISHILQETKHIVGYNVSFDIECLKRFGIKINTDAEISDVMKMFAPVYGEWSDKYGCFRWQKLTTCAAYYDIGWENIKAHDSLADCQATLHCYKKLIGGKENEQMQSDIRMQPKGRSREDDYDR